MNRLTQHRRAIAAAVVLTGLGFGPASAEVAPPSTNSVTPPALGAVTASISNPPAAMPEGIREKLAGFVLQLWPDAERRGVARALFERAFASLEPDAQIFDLLVNQPEHISTPWDYMNRLASEKRIETGRAKLAEHAGLLARIEARYGVDKHVVLAIWGVESSFGVGPGTRHVVRSLTTLAVGDPRRPEFWRNELLMALTILQRGDITLERMTGSWAGAMGHTQFMPATYMAHAVDFDGDGRRDIWNSIPDALASTANYLKVAGWQLGEPWGFEVVLPVGFDYALSRPGTTKPLADWLAMGLALPFGRAPPKSALSFAVVMPAGARGPAFLVSQNYRAILKYNNAMSYALAVGHLADRIGGGEALAGMWPLDDPPLARPGRAALQRLLVARGLETGMTDGTMGSSTRNAIRSAQQTLGIPEDGYASEQLLRQLQAAAGP